MGINVLDIPVVTQDIKWKLINRSLFADVIAVLGLNIQVIHIEHEQEIEKQFVSIFQL